MPNVVQRERLLESVITICPLTLQHLLNCFNDHLLFPVFLISLSILSHCQFLVALNQH
jgi:hypothetical protein